MREPHRQTERVPVRQRVWVESEALPRVWFEAQDASLGGVFLSCELLLDPGTTLRLSLEGELEVAARVAWARWDAASGIGVAFTDLDDSQRRAVAEWLHRARLKGKNDGND